ncbi:LysR substrate-binding domain-containing protein [Mesorhizobium sp. LMG 17147]|uniref:LysR family transcriptional regulator n=1 Tax=Mesorhizobium sp. LMG 17147 TaxID=2963091 RepID=UPI0020CA2587|nr:LysR family transcriptional regulator [Mesorhizobium sp. LMG 17147]MCP9232158.1 LysR substrate-binding domain-containing protein [Mesorhizobium sp. LMG 17147]
MADLRIFRTVVREGGITKAAEKLFRVQSNVTTRIRQLEEDLGVQLFIREGKRLHVSPAGHKLVGYADRLLALAEEARTAMLDPRPRGTLRLGAMESTAAARLPSLLAEYHARYPDVEIQLRTGNPQVLATAMLAGDLDAAFAAEPIADAPFEKLPAFHEQLVIVSAASRVSIDDRQDMPKTMIAFEHGCPHRRRLEQWYARRGFMAEKTIELGSYHAILGCVVAGMGIALMPKSVLSGFPESRWLKLHELPADEDNAVTVLFWRKGAGSPNVTALQGLLAEQSLSLGVAAATIA